MYRVSRYALATDGMKTFNKEKKMACYTPINVKVHGTWQQVNCGECMQCRIKKRMMWETRIRYEAFKMYKAGRGNSFATITYSPENNPINKNGKLTLRQSDMQKLFKRCRKWLKEKAVKKYKNVKLEDLNFKYVYCGEMGSIHGLPHYHVIFFGLDSGIADEMLRNCWREGITKTDVLINARIRYTIKYMEKQIPSKEVKRLKEEEGIESQFVRMSKSVGADLYKSFAEKGDYANEKMIYIPKYYRDKFGYPNDGEIVYRAQMKEKAKRAKWQNIKLEHYLRDCTTAREMNIYKKEVLKRPTAKPVENGRGNSYRIKALAKEALKGEE